MSLDSSPSVKERAAAIDRRVSLEAENESRRLSGESNQYTYRSSKAPYLQKKKMRTVEPLSFQPMRPTRIFSREIEERALQPRRQTPGSITKHSSPINHAGRIQSINEIRESIKVMKQRIDTTLSSDQPIDTEMSAHVTPQRSYAKELDRSQFSGTRNRFREAHEKRSFQQSNHSLAISEIEHDISRISDQPSFHGHPTSNDHEQDRLAMVYAQYLQAMYKASHGAKEMERQQAAAEARLDSAQALLASRQKELNVSESKIRVATEIATLDGLISKQKDSLMQVAKTLSLFKSPVELYMERMDKATVIVPPKDSMWQDLDTLKESVQACSEALGELIKTQAEDKQSTRLLMANQITCTALKEEIDLLCSCKQIIS
ncbi:hypothetical protein K450DRAFT_263297 [Umbelopsis ramanniana AG]|uniref:Uncharacterized protein n=1 Tax=Umbelopsis ramanniana AG TaxID=1314678 RepID=A0AAD5HAF8_UMBRA|nr:uncharacterized protein K450DRAFT_263297 [Umbelopsis ramanniana AG]KAI8575088.1 hypothetical protein K450DRAFT_263297 [Umbelopsis ramanniana AG]